MSSVSPPKARAGSEVIAFARRSIVSVRSVSSGGTGWIAVSNGLVLTSHEAVGYHSEVSVEIQGGRRSNGRVIWVDVMRDLALVLPVERQSLPPILPRHDLPKLGESAFSLSFVPGEPFRAAAVLVSTVDRKIGSIRCFEVDGATSSGGGPIIDVEGRVLGIGGLDLPRGARRRAPPSTERFSAALPITALQRALAAFDLPTEQVEGRPLIYRCPSCSDPYIADSDRCLSCGQLLPHAWEPTEANGAAAARPAPSADAPERTSATVAGRPRPFAVPSPAFTAAERLVREMLGRIGTSSAGARVGPRAWRFYAPSIEGTAPNTVEITLELDEHVRTLRGRVPLVRIPSTGYEAFYRFLLAMNDQTPRSQRVYVDGDTVYLAFAEPIALLNDVTGAEIIQELGQSTVDCRKMLAEPFDAKPAMG